MISLALLVIREILILAKKRTAKFQVILEAPAKDALPWHQYIISRLKQILNPEIGSPAYPGVKEPLQALDCRQYMTLRLYLVLATAAVKGACH